MKSIGESHSVIRERSRPEVGQLSRITITCAHTYIVYAELLDFR